MFRNSQQRLLRLLPAVSGVLTVSALPAVFLPQPTMDYFHRQLGLGALSDGPIVLYLARSLSTSYAAFGALTLLFATDL